jgi:hypothetical protein
MAVSNPPTLLALALALALAVTESKVDSTIKLFLVLLQVRVLYFGVGFLRIGACACHHQRIIKIKSKQHTKP